MPDVVALSMLPKAWRNYDLRQIGDSIVGAVFTMLAADFVLIILPNQDNQLTELLRSGPDLDPASLDHVRTVLKRERATFSDDQRLSSPTDPAATTCTEQPHQLGWGSML